MKSYSDIRLDNERLKLELAHIIQIKDTYEAKFRETNIQLLGSSLAFSQSKVEDLRVAVRTLTFLGKSLTSLQRIRLQLKQSLNKSKGGSRDLSSCFKAKRRLRAD
jgi:hypothetical protein